MTSRRFVLGLVAVFLAALGLRLGMAEAFVGLSAPPDANANSDQVDYEAFASQVARGQGYTLEDGTPTARRPPGTSFTLAPVYAAFGRDWAIGRAWFALVSAATCVLIAIAGRLAVGPAKGAAVGLVAGGLLAVLPEHAYYAAHFLSETPAGFYTAAAIALTLAAIGKPGWLLHTAAGLAWAGAVYCRPQTLLALPVVGAVAMLPYVRARLRGASAERATASGWVRTFALQAAVIALCVTPWFARNAVVMDKATFSTVAGRTFWGAHNEETFTDPAVMGDWVKTSSLPASKRLPKGEVAHDQAAFQEGLAAIARHEAKLPELMLRKVQRAVNPIRETPNQIVRVVFSASGLVVLPLALVGAWMLLRKPGRRSALAVIAAPLLAFGVTTLLFYGSPRFRDAAAPAYALLAALPVAGLLRAVFVRSRQSPGDVEPGDASITLPADEAQATVRRAA
ncbi:MAG: hypothetical protein AAF612_03290 [Planctomycetota bacterium]